MPLQNSLAAVNAGSAMDLVDAPNATAQAALRTGLGIGALTNTGAGAETLTAILGDVASVDIATRLTNILAEIAEVEGHFHNQARWFGKKADQTNPANVWAANALTPYRCISGDGVYGAGASDHALVWGTANAMLNGQTKFDLDSILVVASDATTVWKMRFIYGAGTMADAITAGQYTETMVIVPTQAGKIAKEQIRMPRLTVGTDQVWVQAWNATDDKTIDFFVGIHGYVA